MPAAHQLSHYDGSALESNLGSISRPVLMRDKVGQEASGVESMAPQWSTFSFCLNPQQLSLILNVLSPAGRPETHLRVHDL